MFEIQQRTKVDDDILYTTLLQFVYCYRINNKSKLKLELTFFSNDLCKFDYFLRDIFESYILFDENPCGPIAKCSIGGAFIYF